MIAPRAVPSFGAAVAGVFLVAHLAFLPPSLEDIDSTNFALGLRAFDVAAHQPHAPGYPLFIALGRLSLPVADRVVAPGPGRETAPEARALAFWAAVFGALAAFPLVQFFRCLEGDPRRAGAATILTLAAPLFWFTSARPMSDIPGLAVGLMAMALVATGYRRQRTGDAAAATPDAVIARQIASGRMLVAGALVAGLAIGFRSQNAWLALPLLGFVLLDRIGRGAAGALLGTAMTFTIGVLIWAVPLISATGGPDAYVAAVRAQALEDFSGVDMLLRDPTPRRLAFGLVHTLVHPWGHTAIAVVVLALAAAGAFLMALRSRAGLLLLIVSFGLYGVFHLVFQETVTVRYALPLVPPIAYLAVRGASGIVGRAMPAVVAVPALASLVYTVPLQATYAGTSSPVFSALADLGARLDDSPAIEPPALGLHQVFRRAVVTAGFANATVLPAPPMREWLQLAEYWRQGGSSPVWFVADPRRTDLELIDPASRRIEARYRWAFERLPLMGGVRPDLVDLVRIESPPAWFCGEGWHLTPEALGMAERQARREAVAFVRPREQPAVLFLGGEYLPEPAGPDAEVSIALEDEVLDRWTVRADSPVFLRRLRLERIPAPVPGTFARLVVSYGASGDPDRRVHVRIMQFDLQPASTPMYVLANGWHEREYNAATDRHWRWSSDRSETVVHHAGRDMVLTLSGESPLKSFDAAPHVVVRAGGTVLARAEPSADFDLAVEVPAAALDAADGILTLETDRVFVPAERSSSRDRRRLGLRLYRFELRSR